jgi:hypothetical protein
MSHPVQLLWTSGWDSTFRLLHLVLERRVPVQPWYLNDPERLSTSLEHRTMEEIRGAIAGRTAEAAALIRPTRFTDVTEVAPDETVTARYRRWRLGSQYDWLARFAEQEDLMGLEIGTMGHGRVHQIIGEALERVEGRGGPTYRLVAEPSDPDLLLFRRFEFPLFGVTKKEMENIVRRKGFGDIMSLTWFCHSPKGERPCGHCTPCRITIEKGFAYRIPPLRRVRPRLSKLKGWVKSHLVAEPTT